MPRESGQLAFIDEVVAARAGREWCLFLDRDGVFNRRIVDDYVRSWQDFEWLPNVVPALTALRSWAPHLVVVTNQQGIGKGKMTAGSVDEVHANIQTELAGHGVAIDDFQVCPHLQSEDCSCRKPKAGLILDWLERNPTSEPALSIMVGDSRSDLELARNVAAVTGGCPAIQIGDASPAEFADASFDSLWDFAVAIANAKGNQ